jgi:hypothetical protein
MGYTYKTTNGRMCPLLTYIYTHTQTHTHRHIIYIHSHSPIKPPTEAGLIILYRTIQHRRMVPPNPLGHILRCLCVCVCLIQTGCFIPRGDEEEVAAGRGESEGGNAILWGVFEELFSAWFHFYCCGSRSVRWGMFVCVCSV